MLSNVNITEVWISTYIRDWFDIVA